jgi:glucan phosphoethanolaminetransferase (alkaline phosphatase superfamily)
MKRIVFARAPYLLALASPNLLLHYQETDSVTLILAALASLIIAAIHIGFSWSRWIVIFMLPVFLILPFEIFYTWNYNEAFTIRVLAIALETPNEQIYSYMLPRVPALAAILLMSLLAWGMALSVKTGDGSNSASLKWVRRLCIAGLTACIVAGCLTVYRNHFRVSPLFDNEHFVITGQLVQNTFPIGRVLMTAGYFVELRKQSEIVSQRREKQQELVVQFGSATTERSVVVLVIGESANRDHWGLFGYFRATTPRLSARDDVVPLTDLISPWPSTLMSVPLLLTTKSATDSSLYSIQPSSIAILRKASFETYWLSTQGSVGVFDRSISDIANDAEFRHFVLGPTALRPGQPGNDMELLTYVDTALKSDAKKLFLVLHTQGSHFPYWERYPKEFEKFQPNLKSFHFKDWANDESHREALTNSYDNSVLYTDYFLNEVIERLQLSSREASLIYVADHGESLPTANCDRFGHGFKSPSNFKVPGFIWLSRQTRHERPDLFEKLSRASNQRVTTSVVFPTVLDLARVSLIGDQNTKSLAAPTFRETTRLVNAPKPTNFDTELVPKNGCR